MSLLIIIVSFTYGAPSEFAVTPLPLSGSYGLVMLTLFPLELFPVFRSRLGRPEKLPTSALQV
jgi:hypothetical protein